MVDPQQWLLVLLVVVQSVVDVQNTETIDVKIGALFDYNALDAKQMFNYAVQAHSGIDLDRPKAATSAAAANDPTTDEDTYNPDDETPEARIELAGIAAEVSFGNEYQASRRMCKFLRNGVAAIFGPLSATASMHCTNICDSMDIPYVDFRWDADTKPPVINMQLHQETLALVFVDLVRTWNWKGFTILYESASWLPRAAALLKMYDPKEYTVTVRRITTNQSDNNYRSVLRAVRLSQDVHIVLECSVETLPEVFKQALQVGLLTDQHQFIVTTPDMHTIDLEPFQHSGVNITGIRLVNPENPLVQEVANGIAELETVTSEGLTAGTIRSQTALLYDAVLLLTEAFKQMSPNQLRTKKLICNKYESWENGNTITNFMRNTVVQGLTGEVRFDNEGLRTQFSVDIVELTSAGLVTIGNWKSGTGLLNISRLANGPDDKSAESFLSNQTFIVITSLSAPYGMLKYSSQQLYGNDRYEGFGIDLIHELSLMLGFNYTFILQHDGKYGSIDNTTGQWDGMIRELRDGRADLAITDLTITAERESGVDFTMPFMNLGISILYRKPQKEPPSTFSFMSPFSTEVWIYLGTAYLGVSLCLFVLGRISPSEWDNPYPCIEEPTVLENQFSMRNAMWFTIGALLQQGSEIAPKAPSTRVVASIWWFFTLIIVSSYTANLAAFLTVTSLKDIITSAESLKDCHLDFKKCPVEFGAKKGGSTLNFFKEAVSGTNHDMYKYMEQNPHLLTKDNDEGLAWAKDTTKNYAFLMESSSIEYLVERNCNVTQIGGLLDQKGYGIAMRKNSNYRDALTEGVLRLQEQGKLTALKTKWWQEKKGGGACSKTGDSDSAEALVMANMNGVFIVLLCGSGMATIFGMIDCFLITYRRSSIYKVPFKDEFINELKFVALCHGNTKTVRHRKSASLDTAGRRSYSADSSRNRSQNSKEIVA